MAQCKYCNNEGFSWTETPQGFRLVDEDGEQHKCSSRPPKTGATGQEKKHECRKCNTPIKFKMIDAVTGEDHQCQKR